MPRCGRKSLSCVVDVDNYFDLFSFVRLCSQIVVVIGYQLVLNSTRPLVVNLLSTKRIQLMLDLFDFL